MEQFSLDPGLALGLVFQVHQQATVLTPETSPEEQIGVAFRSQVQEQLARFQAQAGQVQVASHFRQEDLQEIGKARCQQFLEQTVMLDDRAWCPSSPQQQ